MELIPFNPAEPSQEFQVQLEGSLFTFEMRWNTRNEAWFLNLIAGDGTPIWCGQQINTNVRMLRQCVHALRPRGELLVMDTAGADQDPGRDDFGDDKRIRLYYLTAADVASLAGG